MKILIVLLLILGVAFGAYWYLNDARHSEQVQRAQEQAGRRAEEVKDAVKGKLKDWSLSTSEIKEELERTGTVVRKKAREVGAAISDATADARITGIIKAKLVKDPDLSALRISVSTTDGVVTLAGRVSSHEEIKQAMQLALETDGVREVISTLQVRATN